MNRQAIKKIFGLAIIALAVAAPATLAQEEIYVPSKRPPARDDKKAPKAPAPKQELRQEGEAIFGGGKGGSGAEAQGEAWSIVLWAFREGDQAALARDGLARVRSEGRLAEAYLEKRGSATVIAYGRYADPTSKEAQADLAKVRNTEVVVDGVKGKPFANAFLAPPAEIKGSLPQYDLRNARKLHGDWVLYTLQVGAYGRPDRKPPTPKELEEFRRTAEQAVVLLRREGEQAFYYHGPNLSSVTIGLFGEEDFDPETKVESYALRQLRKRFPDNLLNGMRIRMTQTQTDPHTGRKRRVEQFQRSALINVPRD